MSFSTRSFFLLAPTVLVAACGADWPVLMGCEDGCVEPMSTSTTDEMPATPDAVLTVTSETDSQPTGGAESSGGAVSTTGSEATAATDETGDDGGEVLLPEVVAIEVAAEVHAAGPVPITVTTRNALSVRLKQDGVDVGELKGAGEDVFVGELAVKGAVDNGTHHIEAIAARGQVEDSAEATYEVDAPEAGKVAWSMPGPPGSRTNRIALTAEGDVIEAGLRIGAGIPRPSLQKRSGFDGSDLWGKKLLLSELEGHVADVAIAPDGGIWVAMNVKEASQKWRPHLVLLTADGMPTGVDRPGELGYTMRGIAADAEGGCFAVGFAVVEGGDLDVVYQGVNGAHQGTVSGTWDYLPANSQSHSFADAGMDVVIDGDIAWIAGMSVGKHDGKFVVRTRGLLVSLDIHTGEMVGPVAIAPAVKDWMHSMFFGLALYPGGGVMVAGAGCPDVCGGSQRIETSYYTPDGVRTWHQVEDQEDGAYGSDVVTDSQGRVITVGASKQSGVLRGQVLARAAGTNEVAPLWKHWFPVSNESSEALGAAVDKYNRVFVGGYVTAGGVPQARLVQISP